MSFRSVVYFTNWSIYGRKFLPQHLDPDCFTHILYAFANVDRESGKVVLTDAWADTDIHWDGDSWNDAGTNLYGCLKQLHLLKKRNPNLKVLLSIGGWTYSANFQAVLTPAGRAAFAESALQLVRDLGFDGLDIDWEYPQNADEAAAYVALLAACRQALDSYGSTLAPQPYHFELTVACPAGAANYEKLDLRGMDQYLDFWNLMAYDYAGGWDRTAGHQANLFPDGENPARTPFSTQAAVDYYTGQGVAPGKIVIGMPLYGRAFDNTDGLGSSFTAASEGSWENGVFDYKALPLEGAQETFDAAVGAAYCYNPATRRLVTYDSPAAAQAKAAYIQQRGLGGAMWWEASADKTGNDSLVRTVVAGLGGTGALQQKPACTTFPASKYDNLRAGL